MPRLTVEEASVAYIRAMRNPLPGADGVCRICHTFIGQEYAVCLACDRQPSQLDAVVPISYSEHLGQLHTALRGYKDDPPEVQRFARVRLAAILWRFLAAHEECVARAAGVDEFDLVTSVPSSTPDADEERDGLRTIIGWCRPVADRHRRVLRATGTAEPGRAFAADRYTSEPVDNARVLLIDDTWTGGGHAQSAAHALRGAGADVVGLVVIGRHVRPEWVVDDRPSGEILDSLPRFSWETCAVH